MDDFDPKQVTLVQKGLFGTKWIQAALEFLSHIFSKGNFSQMNVMVSDGIDHYRKRYLDLKHVYENQEMHANEPMMRSWDTNKKAEKFEF